MVRSIVAILVTRGMASESAVLMQSQASGEASLKIAGSTRVDKMRMNSKMMEDAYKGLLQKIVDSKSLQDPETGKPYLPDKSFLDIVEQQFAIMKTGLREEKGANEDILAADHGRISECNAARDRAFPTILNLQGAMQGARATHASCRGREDTDIDDMENKCTAFDAIQDKCDQQNIGVNQDWYAVFHENDENPLKTIVNAATDCHEAVEKVKVTASTCDGNQDDFKSAYCSYAQQLEATCTTHSRCYASELQKLRDDEATIQQLERDGKAIYRTIDKIKCYVDELLVASTGGAMPSQAAINTCNGLQVDDSILTITYPTPEVKDDCDDPHHSSLGNVVNDMATASFRPGAGNWYNQEMDGLTNHDKLNADETC